MASPEGNLEKRPVFAGQEDEQQQPPRLGDVGPDEVLFSADDVRNLFLGLLLLLAVLVCCYVAAEILLPIAIALVLMMVLQPALAALEKFHVPRILAALLVIVVFIAAVVGLGALLSAPAIAWGDKLPQDLPRLQQRLGFLKEPIALFQRFASLTANISLGGEVKPVSVTLADSGLSNQLLASTRSLVSGFFEVVLMLFFLLISGETFLRRLVEILPRFKDKRQAVDISQQIQSDVSAYLVTITIMNLVVGALTAAAMWVCGVEDALLWGTLAFALNYVPVLGPLTGVCVFLGVGLLSIDSGWIAPVPAAVYLAIHIAEGETFTPRLLARRFTINPVLVIIGLIFWYWMWGVPGAILSTPMLAIIKIVCDRIEAFKAFGHFIEQ